MPGSGISAARARDLIDTALEVQAKDAQEAGRMGYMPRVLVQTTLPYRDPKTKVYERTNGNLSLTLLSPHGVPYGSIPRYLVSYLASEAVVTRSPEIKLGHSLNDFIERLDMNADGGVIASRLKVQARKFLTTTMNVSVTKGHEEADRSLLITKSSYMAWNPKSPDQRSLWESTIMLTDDFYRECVDHAIPVDMRVLDALRPSPMAMDVYVWLTYRIAIARAESHIPWELLMLQFGSAEGIARRTFVRSFMRALKQVETAANWHPALTVEDDGLIVWRGKPHIKHKKR